MKMAEDMKVLPQVICLKNGLYNRLFRDWNSLNAIFFQDGIHPLPHTPSWYSA
jgi:hypothetical protein